MGNSKNPFDFEKIKKSLKGVKGTTILLVIGFTGVALIFLSEFWPTTSVKSSSSSSSQTNISQYSSQLTNQMEQIIGQINGVGRVHVLVTLDKGVEYVYQQSQKTTNDKTQNSQVDGSTQTQENKNEEQSAVVITNSSGGQNALIQTEIQPTIKGVVVVCDGGNDPVVKENIVNTVMTALNIPSNHISVSKMSK